MIRSEDPKDYDKITQINKEAFKTDKEAKLIEDLRRTQDFNPRLSLVAVEDKILVGHLLLYPVLIKSFAKTLKEVGLGPVAVIPEKQGKGIGKGLIKEGIKRAQEMGFSSITVLGDPKYYSQFGFILANSKGLRIAMDVPQDHFMVLELIPGALEGIKGLVYYAKQFNALD